MKRINLSSGWKLFGAFGASLLIVIIIGLIGISQIKFLSTKVDMLGRRYLPMQAAAQELKASNTLYVTGIKNYALWEGSRYLEAARAAPDLESAEIAVRNFYQQVESYQTHLNNLKKDTVVDKEWLLQQKRWIEEISVSQEELKGLGLRIVELIKKGAESGAINMLIMELDSTLYRINDFIGETIQKDITNSVQDQILEADQAKRQALIFLWWSLALGVFIGGQTAWLVSRNLKREAERRQSIVREMIRTEERERQHLSAQVHDQMSQDLGALKIYLNLIQQQSGKPSKELDKKIDQGKEIVTGLLDKSHNISLLLRPPSLDEVGLIGSLEGLIIDYQRLSKAKFTFQKPKKDLKLSPEHSLYLYRFTQEALTNAVKYAAAENIWISLRSFTKKVELVYQDDGRGFNFQELLHQSRQRTEDKVKLGLLSLQERAELLGGSMNIESAFGKGTRITVWLSA